MGVPPNPDFG